MSPHVPDICPLIAPDIPALYWLVPGRLETSDVQVHGCGQAFPLPFVPRLW